MLSQHLIQRFLALVLTVFSLSAIRTQVEDWKGISVSGKRLTLARLLETKTLAPGDYEVAIRVHDGVSGQALAQSAKFTVVEQ